MNECRIGDCRDVMREMAVAGLQVQTIVTSPPYFGLRDYGVDGQLGLEEAPDEYISAMVDVFRAAREVLRDDGTLWLNIGDSYAGSWEAQGKRESPESLSRNSIKNHPKRAANTGSIRSAGMKPKDLMGIPWMLAFALRADGWYLRQDIIWHKPNPMPESVQDRCTKAHEYVFLLSKSDRYFYDAAAISEVAQCDRGPGNINPSKSAAAFEAGDEHHRTKSGLADYASRQRSKRNSFARETKATAGEHGQKPQHRPDREHVDYVGRRNKRSVWTVPTQPYGGAHFAVMPLELAEQCVLAGSRPGDIVLDPFMGSGTVAAVAQRLGRRWMGAELNPAYLTLQAERTRQHGLVLEHAA